MTYRELLAELQLLTAQQLDQDVTVFVREIDEYYALVVDYPFCEASYEMNDQLDPGHKYLVI